MWTYKPPFYAVDEHFERADGPQLPVGQSTVDRIALYHYVVKCAAMLTGVRVRVESKVLACGFGAAWSITRKALI